MRAFPLVILGGGVAAGYAAKEFVLQGGDKKALAILTAENCLPYERPPLSKGFLAGEETTKDILISPPEFYREHGITVLRNFPVTQVDFRRRTLRGKSGQSVRFDKLLIATGSTLRRLAVPGSHLRGLFYLRQIPDSEAIRAGIRRGKRAVVMGAGFIGMEVASVLASRGVRTTLVFPQERVWQKVFTPELSGFFERRFAMRGVKLLPGEKVAAIRGRARVSSVVLKSGTELPADLVVAGIGVTPSLELFQDSDLKTDEGILVNELLETNLRDVWAAGDVARYPDAIFRKRQRIEHWENAAAQGRVAMANMMDRLIPFTHVPYFFSDVFDLSYQFWGDPSGHDRVVYRGQLSRGTVSAWWFRNHRLCAAFVMNRPDEECDVATRWILRRAHVRPEELHRKNLKALDETFGQLSPASVGSTSTRE